MRRHCQAGRLLQFLRRHLRRPRFNDLLPSRRRRDVVGSGQISPRNLVHALICVSKRVPPYRGGHGFPGGGGFVVPHSSVSTRVPLYCCCRRRRLWGMCESPVPLGVLLQPRPNKMKSWKRKQHNFFGIGPNMQDQSTRLTDTSVQRQRYFLGETYLGLNPLESRRMGLQSLTK